MPILHRLNGLLALAAALCVATAANAAQPADRLEKVVVLSRHSVRAAMSSPEQLEMSSARPWPRFSVPAGHLTPNGAELSRLFGRYYRELYASEGLLSPGDCSSVYYWANVTQRTIATAKALGEGLTPGCENTVHTVGEGNVDPLFEAVGAGVSKPDLALARAAIAGRIGAAPKAWSASHRDAIETLDVLLLQCESRPCPADADKGAAKPKNRVTAAQPAISDKDGLPVELSGPEAFASGVTESLLMAWADGQDFASLGWKGLDEDSLLRVFALHQAEFDLRLRAPYVSQATSSYLATRLLGALQGGAVSRPAYPAIKGADDRAKMVVVVGHDGTLAMLSGLLRLEWATPGYQPNQIAPGGALVFERWLRADGKRVIRARYTTQTLSQLRDRIPLTLAAPPAASPLFIPGCSQANATFDCPLDQLAKVVQTAIDPTFIGKTR